jgi:hypothetical protein
MKPRIEVGRKAPGVTGEGELLSIGEAKLPHIYHPVVVL